MTNRESGGELEAYLGEDIHHRSAVAWIARLRVPLGFLFAVLTAWLATPTVSSLVAGGGIACAGEALRVWAAGHLNKSREVTVSGPYRWMAHPLYVGTAVIGGGVAVACRSVVLAIAIAGYLAATLIVAMRREDAFLRAKFGAAYASYRAREAAPSSARGRRFSFARARANREYRAAFGLIAALAGLASLVALR
jgi:hypothetical protein